MASAACAEDQLEWCGLIESKVRLLIMTLERNQHIVLAHVNPECYPGMPPAPDTPSTPANMWFIGLVFAKTENLNVDLTYDIQHFTNQGKVYFVFNISKFRESLNIFIWSKLCLIK